MRWTALEMMSAREIPSTAVHLALLLVVLSAIVRLERLTILLNPFKSLKPSRGSVGQIVSRLRLRFEIK